MPDMMPCNEMIEVPERKLVKDIQSIKQLSCDLNFSVNRIKNIMFGSSEKELNKSVNEEPSCLQDEVDLIFNVLSETIQVVNYIGNKLGG